MSPVSPDIFKLFDGKETYDVAKKVLTDTFIKKKNYLHARQVLNSRHQRADETLEQYITVLYNLSKDCEDKTLTAAQHKEEAILLAFLLGVRSNEIRVRILENDHKTLDDALKTARSIEAAKSDSSAFLNPHSHTEPDTGSVAAAMARPNSKDDFSRKPSEKTPCYYCGLPFHPRSKCPALHEQFSKCGRTGHYGRCCQNSKRNKLTGAMTAMPPHSVQSPKATESSNVLDKLPKSEDSSKNSVPTPTAPTQQTQEIFEPRLCAVPGHVQEGVPTCLSKSSLIIQFRDKDQKTLADTCSSDSYIGLDFVEKHNLKIVTEHGSTMMADSSQSAATIGHCMLDFSIGERKYTQKFSVMPNLCCEVLFGQDFMNKHKSVVLDSFDGVGNLHVTGLAMANVDTPQVFPHLKENCSPIATKSRRFNDDELSFVREEIQHLLDEDIIEPSNSPWRAQVVIVDPDDDIHRKRMVIDYSRTINKFTDLDAYPTPRIDTLVEKVSKYKVFSTLDLKSAYHQIPIGEADRPYTAFEADGRLYQFKRLSFGLTNGVPVFQRVMDEFIAKNNLEDTWAYLDNIILAGMDQEEHDKTLDAFMDSAKKS